LGAYCCCACAINPTLPAVAPFFSNYIDFLFLGMGLPAIGSVTVAWLIEHSRIGRGFAAIRDNEEAAECTGVPALRLKLLATTVSGCLMGVAGAPLPPYPAFLRPPAPPHPPHPPPHPPRPPL